VTKEEKFQEFLKDISDKFCEFENANGVVLSSTIAFSELGTGLLLSEYTQYRYNGDFKYDKKYVFEKGKEWCVGDVVKKKSDKPFKNGEKTDEISYFTTNPQCPHNPPAVFLKNSQTIVNISQLESV
jgi:hypothetical protein